MNYDIVLCGAGGQGGISVSVVLDRAAMSESLQVKQSEVHGMALRIADGPIASPLISEGSARLLLAALRGFPRSVIIEAEALARQAGNPRAANMVLIGAAAKFLPFSPESLERAIEETFSRKGEAVVNANLKAFSYGRKANP
jgi:indolepyruvate ferredoxin oxidoreductase, beta subunit